MPTATSSALPDRIVRGHLTFSVESRPQRRTVEITVERDATLSVKAPPGTSIARIEGLIDAKAEWIHRKLAEKHALWGTPVAKQIVDGEGFAYLGRSYRLLLHRSAPGDARPPVHLARGRLHMAPSLAATPDLAAEALRDWYQRVGTPWLERRIRTWAARMDAAGIEVHVADLGYRWGSTSGRSRINVHWATLQHRPALIDYVLVHELAHIHVTNHGPEFWRLVTQALPDHDHRRRELASTGAQTWLGAITD